MARLRDGGPYIWATWLTKLLAGEDSCEWSSWFKSQYDSRTWEKAPSNYDLAQLSRVNYSCRFLLPH